MMPIKLDLIDESDKFYLYDPWDNGHMPVYVQLRDIKGEWTLYMGAYEPGKVPVSVHERDGEFWWRAQPYNATAANSLLKRVVPILRGYPSKSRVKQDAADERIMELVDTMDPSEIIEGMGAAAFCEQDEILRDTDGDQVEYDDEGAVFWSMEGAGSILPHTTDDELNKIVKNIYGLSQASDCFVYNIREYVRDTREMLLRNSAE